MSKTILDISTYEGDVTIRESELSSITDADLTKLRISRKELHRLFAEGKKLMQGTKVGDRGYGLVPTRP